MHAHGRDVHVYLLVVTMKQIGSIPHWQKANRIADLDRMMQGMNKSFVPENQICSDCRDVFMREIQGMQVNSNVKAAFEEKYLRELEDTNNMVDIDNHVRYIVVSVDPNGGGRNSDYAVVSACYTESGTMIVSAC